MERRLLTFIVASTAFFFFYMSLRIMFGPPPPQVAENDAAAEVEGVDPQTGEPNEVDGADEPDSDVASRPADGDAEAGQESSDEAAIKRPESPNWLTLGSMDPASNHYLLVTLTSLGGAIERIELTARDEDGKLKYRRVDVRYGYLGYLAGTPASQLDGGNTVMLGVPSFWRELKRPLVLLQGLSI